MTSVAIILVHFNSEPETLDCLHSLKQLEAPKNVDICTYVIDNGSKELLEISESKLPANTRVVRSDTNLGFTDGNNLGIDLAIKECRPDYVLLLNNDTTVSPDFLTHLLKEAERNPKLGMAVPKIYFSPDREFHHESYTAEQRGKVLWFAGGSLDWSNLDAFHRGVDEVDRGQFDTTHETEFATGCCLLIPTKVIERVGMLNPDYFLYLEDVDWSMRVVEAGYEVLFVPESVIWHKNAGSSGGSGSPLQQYYQNRNRLYFFMKFAHVHFLPPGKKKTFMRYAALSWFYMRIFKLAGQQLISHNGAVRQAAFDWLFRRMGKQQVY